MTDTVLRPAPARPARPRWRPGPGPLALIDQAVVSGASFATSVLVARAWSPDEFGVYSLALGLTLVARAVLGELVASPYTVYSGRYQGRELAEYTGSTLVHYLVLTGLAGAGLAAATVVLWVRGAEAAGAVGAAAVACPFLLLREYVRRVDLAQLEVGAVLATDAAVAAGQMGGLVLLWECRLLSVVTALGVLGAAAAAAFVVWCTVRLPAVRVVPARVGGDWRQNWGFARWAVVGFMVGSATPYVLPWVIASAAGEGATGVFVACVTLVNVAGMYIAGVTNYLTPRAARAYTTGGVGELRRVLGRTALMFSVILGGFAAAVAAAGDRPAVLVYGPAYAGCGTVLAVLAAQVWVTSLGVTAGNGLWALDRPRANAAADAITILATVMAVWVLLPPYGVVGAALGALAGTTVGVLARVAVLLRLLRGAAGRPGPVGDVR